MVDLYDEAKDTFFTISWKELLHKAALDEADTVKFNDMGNAPDVKDVKSTTACFDWHDKPAKTKISVVRPVNGAVGGAGNAPLTQAAGIAKGQVAGFWEPTEDDGSGLVLVTTKASKSMNSKKYQSGDDVRKREVESFYTASGWFNGVNKGTDDITTKDSLIYLSTLLKAPNGVRGFEDNIDTAIAANNLKPLTVEQRNAAFSFLAMGSFAPNNDGLDPMVNFGLRPNLHIGKMVFSDIRPDMMRFKHVAAHITAQTVVTRRLATRLLQQVEGADKVDKKITDQILYLFGVCTEMPNNGVKEFFNLKTSVLAYMAAAVLHPSTEVRNTCSNTLSSMGYDLADVGDNLVTWFKVFLNSMPISRNGAESPMFDAYEQGRVLEKTFESLGADPEYQGGVWRQDMAERLPVVYLGEYIKEEEARVAYMESKNKQTNAADRRDQKKVAAGAQVPKFEDRGANDLGMNRDVDENTFSSRSAYVFPGGKQKVRAQDVMAVNKTATSHDALVAFVTIMCKRFFTSKQQLYVELAKSELEENPASAQLVGSLGVSRRALTSNEYPSRFAGKKDQLESQDKWEIVIVRPNIEHNMLAAILGRGGIDDLGATFWGQTELSCYDDSMHGVW